jgi:hypothetical protein
LVKQLLYASSIETQNEGTGMEANTQAAHTATPYYADTMTPLVIQTPDGKGICKVYQGEHAAANVRFIVRACNAFQGMVDALQMAKHIVANDGTQEQLDQVFAALEQAGVQP